MEMIAVQYMEMRITLTNHWVIRYPVGQGSNINSIVPVPNRFRW